MIAPKVNEVRASISTFEGLIAPHETAEFFARYWERDRLHIQRYSPGYYDHLFSLDDIESWLLSAPVGGPTISVMIVPPEGSKGEGKRYRRNEISPGTIYEALAKGSSLVINGLEGSWNPLSPLLKSLGVAFCAGIGVNAYLTPRGSQTFHVHFDNHDVFILQVYGQKEWRLYEFEHLPIRNLDYRGDLNFPGYWSRPEDSPLLEELHIGEGDLLYIPRGMPHCAVAKAAPSLHLTISINPLYWLDFMKAALEQTCFDVPLMRETLPPGFVSERAIQERMREKFSSAVETLSQEVSFEDALRVVMRKCVREQGFPADGHIAELLRLNELTPESEIERRENILCMVEASDEFAWASIRFASGHVRGPRNLKGAFEFIKGRERFRVADLPGLDDQSKVVLIRRLIREGLLRFARGH